MRTLRWLLAGLSFALAAQAGADVVPNGSASTVPTPTSSRDDRAEALPPQLNLSDGFADQPGEWSYYFSLRLEPGAPALARVDIHFEEASARLIHTQDEHQAYGVAAEGDWVLMFSPTPHVDVPGTVNVRLRYDITYADGQRRTLSTQAEFTEKARAEQAAARAWPRRVPHTADAPYRATLDGGVVYANLCAGCHATGVGGAPGLARAEWESRLAQGRQALYRHAIDGYEGEGIMPARGGHDALSDEQVEAAVDWMLANLD
jgi:cytochrome c5